MKQINKNKQTKYKLDIVVYSLWKFLNMERLANKEKLFFF